MRTNSEKGKEYLYRSLIIITGVFCFFLIGERGYMIWPDSYGYIVGNYGREAFYPMVIALCRRIFGENLYLYAVVYLQSILALGVTIYITGYFRKRFSFNRLESYICYLLVLLPYGLDTMWAEPRVNYTHSILSDSLSYSFFYLFVAELIRYIREQKWKPLGGSILLCSIMTLNRSQMEVCYVVVLVAVVWCHCKIQNRKLHICWKKIIKQGMLLLCAVGVTIFMTYGYSYLRWGEFARSSENDFTMLTNLLYTAEAQDEALFEDETVAEAFRELYARVDEARLTHNYAPSGILSQGEYMLLCHDPMKSGIIRPFFQQYIEERGLEESFHSDQIKKALAVELKAVLLKEHFRSWIFNGLCMVPRGIMYAVTPVIPSGMEGLARIYTGLIVGVFFGLYCSHIIRTVRERRSDEERVKRIQLEQWIGCMVVFVGVNIIALCIIILVNSRYVNYTQGMFYIMLYLLLRDAVRDFVSKRRKKTGIC